MSCWIEVDWEISMSDLRILLDVGLIDGAAGGVQIVVEDEAGAEEKKEKGKHSGKMLLSVMSIVCHAVSRLLHPGELLWKSNMRHPAL